MFINSFDTNLIQKEFYRDLAAYRFRLEETGGVA